jgi:hypothetical protein
MLINSNIVHTMYSSHLDAEAAFKVLHNAYFARKELSQVNTPYRDRAPYLAENANLSHHNPDDHISSWGRFGAVCGWTWGMGFGIAFSIVPGMAPIIDGGPIAGWLAGAFVCAVISGSLSTFGAIVYRSLHSIPRNNTSNVLKHRMALKAANVSILDTAQRKLAA